jgi:hypothetical protein
VPITLRNLARTKTRRGQLIDGAKRGFTSGGLV